MKQYLLVISLVILSGISAIVSPHLKARALPHFTQPHQSIYAIKHYDVNDLLIIKKPVEKPKLHTVATVKPQSKPKPADTPVAVITPIVTPATVSPPVIPSPQAIVSALPSEIIPPAGCEQYVGLLSKYSWNLNTALQVINAESGCDANQDTTDDYHPTCMGSRGLFQIGCDSTDDYTSMFDPAANIAQAWALYQERGWEPWSATTCKVKVVCV